MQFRRSHHCHIAPTRLGMLSRHKHCSKGAQPVPKAVYRSSCRDKHDRPRCDSNPGPLTQTCPWWVYFYRAMLCIRGTSHGPVSVRLSVSVSVSVTSRSSTKTAKRRITQITPHDSPGTLVFWCQRGHPLRGRRIQVGWVKIGYFRQIAGYISKTVQDRRMVSIKVE